VKSRHPCRFAGAGSLSSVADIDRSARSARWARSPTSRNSRWPLNESQRYVGKDGKSWVLSLGCRSATHWTYTKRRLAFCRVTQDGEDEGCFTVEQAEVIRDVLGIRKRVDIAPEELERRRALMKRLALAPGSANETGPASEPLEQEAAILGADPPRELEEASTEQPALDDAIPA